MAVHRIYIDGTWYLLPIPEKADTLEATVATDDNKFMTPKKTKQLIDSLDLGVISEVVTTGTGNAVTNITVSSDGKTLTATKGSTFSLSTHSHGNITNDGRIGTVANRVIVTGPNGALIAKPAGNPGQFLSSDGSWATPIASANTSIDYNWTGEHVFQKQITLTGDVAGTVHRYPSIKANIYTPEGTDTKEWEMPSLSGKLATLDNIPGVVYGYCSTSASTTAKVVSSNTFTSHKAGQIYVIEFVNGNTATAPTININSTGAVGVRHLTTNGAVTTSPGTAIMYARSRTIWTFVYNGTYLIPIGKSTRYWNALETKMLGYSKGSSGSAITTSDTVSSAIGKLEYRLDNSSGSGGGSYSSYSNYLDIMENTGTVQFTVAQNTKFLEVTLHRYGNVRGRIFLSIDDFDWNMWMGWIDLTGIGEIMYLGAGTFEVHNPGDATHVSWTEHRWN